MKITAKVRHELNRNLLDKFPLYHISIPIDEIQKRLSISGYRLVQEDGTSWSGIFCGEQGGCHILLGDTDCNIIENACLVLQWYKMQSSRYEINTYIS